MKAIKQLCWMCHKIHWNVFKCAEAGWEDVDEWYWTRELDESYAQFLTRAKGIPVEQPNHHIEHSAPNHIEHPPSGPKKRGDNLSFALRSKGGKIGSKKAAATRKNVWSKKERSDHARNAAIKGWVKRKLQSSAKGVATDGPDV